MFRRNKETIRYEGKQSLLLSLIFWIFVTVMSGGRKRKKEMKEVDRLAVFDWENKLCSNRKYLMKRKVTMWLFLKSHTDYAEFYFFLTTILFICIENPHGSSMFKQICSDFDGKPLKTYKIYLIYMDVECKLENYYQIMNTFKLMTIYVLSN